MNFGSNDVVPKFWPSNYEYQSATMVEEKGEELETRWSSDENDASKKYPEVVSLE